jgi:hypothetical protein
MGEISKKYKIPMVLIERYAQQFGYASDPGRLLHGTFQPNFLETSVSERGRKKRLCKSESKIPAHSLSRKEAIAMKIVDDEVPSRRSDEEKKKLERNVYKCMRRRRKQRISEMERTGYL